MVKTTHSSTIRWLLAVVTLAASSHIVGCARENRNERNHRQRALNQYFESLVEEDPTLTLDEQDRRAATILALRLKISPPQHPRRLRKQPTAADVELLLGVPTGSDLDIRDSKNWQIISGDEVVNLTAKWSDGNLVVVKHTVMSGGNRIVTESVGLSSGDWKYRCETPQDKEFSPLQSAATARDESVLHSAQALMRKDSNPSHKLVNEFGNEQGARPWLLAPPYPTREAVETEIGKPDAIGADGSLVWQKRTLRQNVSFQFLEFDMHIAGTKETIARMSFDQSDKGLARMTLYNSNGSMSVGRRWTDFVEKVLYRQ